MRVDILLCLSLFLAHVAIYPFRTLLSLTWFGNFAQGVALFFAAFRFSQTALKVDRKTVQVLNSIALGFWVCVVAHTLLAYSEILLGKPATGTVTDAIWLVGYFFVARSLTLKMAETSNRSKVFRRTLQFLTVSLGITVAALWPVLMNPARTILTRSIQLVFPLLDFWIAITAIFLFRSTRFRGWILLGMGSLITGIADLIFAYFYNTISPVYRFLDVPLFVGYSFWWLSGAYFFTHLRPSALVKGRALS